MLYNNFLAIYLDSFPSSRLILNCILQRGC